MKKEVKVSEPNGCYRKNGAVVARKIADEVVLVPICDNLRRVPHVYTMNRVGARVWELIDGTRTLDGIAEVLVQEYEVDLPQAKADVASFLKDLKTAGAIDPAA